MKEEVIDCIYRISCGNCEKCYIGETGRKFGTRLKEHKTEVDAICSKPFTRKQRATSLSEQNKSALTDQVSHHNHVIIGQRLQFWTENRTKILDGSMK